LEVVEEVPPFDELKERIYSVIQTITRLRAQDIEMHLEKNPVTGEFDDRQIFVTLPNRAACDAVYRASPLFGCLVVVKIAHTQIYPFRRYSADMCLMCTSKKDPRCIYDCCRDCCSRQKYGVHSCHCSEKISQQMVAQRKEVINSLQ
jgi:hypothetical protein